LIDLRKYITEEIQSNFSKLLYAIHARSSDDGFSELMDDDFDFDFLRDLAPSFCSTLLCGYEAEDLFGGNFPQKIVFFKADESTLRSRLSSRAQMDGIEARGFSYLLRVQDAMEEILQKLDVRYVTIDAAWDEEKITNLIKEFIND